MNETFLNVKHIHHMIKNLRANESDIRLSVNAIHHRITNAAKIDALQYVLVMHGLPRLPLDDEAITEKLGV